MSIKKVSNILKSRFVDFETKFQPAKLLNKKLNTIIRKDKTKADLASFLHGAMGSVAPSTWIKGIRNNQFTTWPGLTEKLVKKKLIPTIATAEGHLALQSTKKKKNKQTSVSVPENNDNFPPLLDFLNVKTHEALYFLTTSNDPRAYTNLSGKFPIQSSRGNNYVLVAYHYNANAILNQPLKNRQEKSIVDAWTILNTRFAKSGNQPTTYVMDNE